MSFTTDIISYLLSVLWITYGRDLSQKYIAKYLEFAAEPAHIEDHALGERYSQTFLLRKRYGQFAITKITSDVEGLVLTKDPLQTEGSTYRIDVALDPQRLKFGKLEGFIKIGTNDKNFPEIKIPVAGRVF